MDDDPSPPGRPASGGVLFDCIVCGIDGSPAGEEAARQADAVEGGQARTILLAATSPEAAAHPEASLMLEGRAPAVAERLADRLDAGLAVITVTGAAVDAGKLPPRAAATVLVDERDPVSALVAAADDADLVVVGSRGLTGLRTLGSVSERLTHKAPASVLVVRDARRTER